MKTFNAPLKFRVIDTRTGEVIINSTKYFINMQGALTSFGYESVNYMPSAAIGMTDSKGTEIYNYDIGHHIGSKSLHVVLWNQSEISYKLTRLGAVEQGRISLDVEDWIVCNNIYEPQFKQYLDQLTQQ